MPQTNPPCPRATFAKNKKLDPQNVFLERARAGCGGDATSLYKNLVKNRKTNFRRQAIQEPIFLWLIEILKAITMGVVARAALFWSSVPNPAIASPARQIVCSTQVKHRHFMVKYRHSPFWCLCCCEHSPGREARLKF
jgi:hypothetical protein